MLDRLVQFVIDILHLFRFWAVIPQYAGGVILRLGKLHRPAKLGFNWVWPFGVEVVLSANVLPETMKLEPQSLTTQDDKSIVLSTVVTFSISDVEKFLLHVDGAKQAIEDTAYGLVESHVRSRPWARLLADDPANDITIAARRAAKKYGVEIIKVQFGDFSRSRSYRLLQHSSHSEAH